MFDEWIEGRITLAERLARGDCGGSVAEAFLILSSLISGIAAHLWPGRRLDRQRFVELWARYADPQLSADLISVPLLIHELDRTRQYSLSDRLREQKPEAFMPRGLPDTLVVTGEDVDVFDTEIHALLPEVALSKLREWSYANVFYAHFRSGYVHEYQVGTHADEVVMSHTRSFITYGNFDTPPYRRINFEVDWVAKVARSLVRRAEPEWQHRPLPKPATWWVDGAA